MDEEKYFYHAKDVISLKEIRTLDDDKLLDLLDEIYDEGFSDGIYAERESNE